MKKLKNIDILIGRNPQDSSLLLAIKDDADYKTIAVGGANSVPQSVSRCRPEQEKSHCILSFDANGNMQVVNTNPNNITCIGGVQISRKNVKETDIIALGDGNYKITVSEVISGVRPLFGYSIDHLEEVWSEYETTLAQIEKRVKARGSKRMVAISLTGVLTAVSAVLFKAESAANALISLSIALISGLYVLKIVLEKDTSQEDRAKAKDELFKKYRCPNPECKHFFGYAYEYRMLKENKCCPYCRKKISDI